MTQERKFNSKIVVSQSADGFTLIEVLLVVALVGIISAIAAPSWISFLTQQRLNTVRTDLLSILRSTQQEAQSLQKSKTVELSTTDLSVTVKTGDSTTGVKTILGESNFAKKFSLTTTHSTSNTIIFNYDGAVRTEDLLSVMIKDNNSPAQSCVIITTLLGGLKPSSGDLCDTFFSL